MQNSSSVYFINYDLSKKVTWDENTEISRFNQDTLYFQLFEGNKNNNETKRNVLLSPVIAQYVRLLPTTWQGNIALKWDIEACRSGRCHSQTYFIMSSEWY